MQIKHAFTSAKADGPDSTRLRPSNWNADHVVTAANGPSIIGRTAAGPGPMTEVPISQVLPIATVVPYAGIAAPGGGWLFPFGQLLNRTTYALLFAAVGTTYGAGDGVTTFGCPDLRGVVPAGKSDMGGSNKGNLPGGTVLGALLGVATSPAIGVTVTGVTGGISGATFGSLSVGASGQTAGPDNVISRGDQGGGTQVASQSHTHSVNVTGGTSGSLGVTGSFSGTGVGATGSFSIVQPTIVMNYIINTGV